MDALILFFTGMTGALAPFSYLVLNIFAENIRKKFWHNRNKERERKEWKREREKETEKREKEREKNREKSKMFIKA